MIPAPNVAEAYAGRLIGSQGPSRRQLQAHSASQRQTHQDQHLRALKQGKLKLGLHCLYVVALFLALSVETENRIS